MTFGLVELAEGSAGFGLFEAAGGFVTFVFELFEPELGPFPANVDPPLDVAGVDLFQSVAATPSPATSTNKMIRNGRYRFIERIESLSSFVLAKMKLHDLFETQRGKGMGLPGIIAEFDFKDVVLPFFHNCANVTSTQPF